CTSVLTFLASTFIDIIISYFTYFIGGVIARWGGEEFVILLENVTLEQSITKANQLREVVERTSFPHTISLTISMGIKMINSQQSIQEMIEDADAMLYQAKNSGRNRVCYN
ncbi:MAG: GGDEF domain-containing protein, partial [Campylobacterales bacterium]|nr:GGDEF domain-containing protein [Campylobacterales bacterium]